jgi:hypothetical protein
MISPRLTAVAFATALFFASEAVAGGVVVPMENVALVSFKHPVATVYIGNPSIAELTMLDSRHVFVLGKRFGATNLIALSADKSIVANEPVLVSSRTAGAVTIFRGTDTYNFSCTTAHCEARPVPGDAKTYFDNTEGAANAHEDTANKAANGGSGQSTEH